MDVKVDADGRALDRAFRALPAAIRKGLEKETTAAARDVAGVVRGLLRKGPRTGAAIGGGSRGRKKHSSAPGEPPARRTGALARSIKVFRLKGRRGPIGSDVRATVRYGMALEYGRKKGGVIQPRPFLRPARDSRQEQTFARISAGIAEALRAFEQTR